MPKSTGFSSSIEVSGSYGTIANCSKPNKAANLSSNSFSKEATLPLLEQNQPNSSGCCPNPFRSKFRYLIALLVIAGHGLHLYANYTLYIVAVEMISSDVLTRGETEIKAKHLAQDPFAEVNTNVAEVGSCPLEIHNTWSSAFVQKYIQLNSTNTTALKKSAIEVSERERQLIELDTIQLVNDVQERLKEGKLVSWDISQRGLIFTACTSGALLFAVPMSRLGLRYGAKPIVLVGMASSALRAALLPYVAGMTPFWVVFVFEFVLGALGHGTSCLVYPLAAAWLLPQEASVFVSIVNLYGALAMTMASFVSTQLLGLQVEWPWCFYLAGK